MTSKEARHLERAGRVPPDDCKCAGCAGLAKRYKGDADLLAFYRRKLLQFGWAGNADDVEKAYQQSHAPWAKALQERGVLLGQEMAQRRRVAAAGEAPAAPDEEMATLGDGGVLEPGKPTTVDAPADGAQGRLGI